MFWWRVALPSGFSVGGIGRLARLQGWYLIEIDLVLVDHAKIYFMLTYITQSIKVY